MNIHELETWHFGINNDELVNLVLSLEKTATTYLKKDEEVPKSGDLSILVFSNEKKACITKTTNVIVTEFKNIDEDLAKLEGEGDKSLDYYKKVHTDYFKTIDPTFNDDTLVVFETFEVVEDLRKTRLSVANTIIKNNIDIFKNKENLVFEINAGFNNDIFDVDDKYIIKICSNKDNESEFYVESNFYKENKDCKYIPKLYKADFTKTIVPFVYEIIEKIPGKSLYYQWYKMTEKERQETIRELVYILKDIHKEKEIKPDWVKNFKEELSKHYQKVKNRFNIKEQKLIENTFSKMDKYISKNKIVLVHNDLHFDNIIKNDKGLFLIDFNDAKYAPFDYDLRLLFMHKDTPWKWANIEMDPFQKEKDYKNIVVYLKKYYKELNNINYLNKRMNIYKLENDIELFIRFNNLELKNNIINYCNEILS